MSDDNRARLELNSTADGDAIFECKVPPETVESWFTRASEVRDAESLLAFFQELAAVEHDYNSVVEAMAACAIATCWAFDRSAPHGGITGFQASVVAWRFFARWLRKEGPLKILDFELMLYPQYARHFEASLRPETFKWLQEQAAKRLEEPGGATDVRAHWKRIVEGHVPFSWFVGRE